MTTTLVAPEQPCVVRVDSAGMKTVVHLAGRIDAAARATLLAVATDLGNGGSTSPVRLDMTAVNDVDESGWAVLADFIAACMRHVTVAGLGNGLKPVTTSR